MRNAIRRRLRRLEQLFAPEVDYGEVLGRVIAEYDAARAAGADYDEAERTAGAVVVEEYRTNPQAVRFARSIAIGIRIVEPGSWFGPRRSDAEPHP